MTHHDTQESSLFYVILLIAAAITWVPLTWKDASPAIGKRTSPQGPLSKLVLDQVAKSTQPVKALSRVNSP